MSRLLNSVTRTLSVRISLMVVLAIALLLLTALFTIFTYSRKVLREEAIGKATETLDNTVLQIDKVLLSVEQSSGNVYSDLMLHLHEPDRMAQYALQLVETSPYVTGCAIAFEPYYYPSKGQYYMPYFYRETGDSLKYADAPIMQSATYGNMPYNEQVWYTEPLLKQHPVWVTLKNEDTSEEAVITFSLPIYEQGSVVGVLGVDVSLALLGSIVAEAKPSPHSYAILIDAEGSYVVHPDSIMLRHGGILSPLKAGETDFQAVGKAMMAGATDYRELTVDGRDAYIFFKPFRRSVVPGRVMDDIGWSVAIVYPEEDIFGKYHQLLTIVLLISIVGLLLLFLLCRGYTHRQLLPLRHLTASAQRIANGQYDVPVPDVRQHDEVGRLQVHFQQMQQALSVHVGELQQLSDSLVEQGQQLAESYEKAREADHMKTAFLHNMTNQMVGPADAMEADVAILCDQNRATTEQETSTLMDNIQQQGEAIASLLNQLLDNSRGSRPLVNNPSTPST